MCRSHCTDHVVLVCAAGSSLSLIGIDSLADQEQFALLQPLQSRWRAVVFGCCGRHGRMLLLQLCSAKLCHGVACTCMAKPGCMCFASVVFVDIVDIGAGTEPKNTVVMCVAMDHAYIHVRIVRASMITIDYD